MFVAVIVLVIFSTIVLAFVGLSEAHAGVKLLMEEVDERASSKDDPGFRTAA